VGRGSHGLGQHGPGQHGAGQPGPLRRRKKRRPDRHFEPKIEASAAGHSGFTPKAGTGFWKSSFFSNIWSGLVT
jgi:hypothetical protein